MPDESLDLLIRQQGAEETAGAINSVGDAAAGTADKVKQTAPAQEESSKATDKNAFSHREMHKAMHLVGGAAPEVGIALKGMVSAPTAGLAALLYMTERLKHDLADLQNSLSTSEWETYKGVVEEVKKGLQEAALEVNAFARGMERQATATQTATDAAKQLADVERSRQDAKEAVESARKNLEMEQAKRIQDPVARAQKELEIENRYAQEKKKRDDEAAQNDLGRKRETLAKEEDAATAAGKKLEEARAKQKGLGTEGEVNKKVETDQARLDAINKELEEKTKRHQELVDKGWLRRSTPQQMEMNELATQIQSLEQQRGQAMGVVSKEQSQKTGKLDAIRAADEEVKELEKKQTEAKARAQALRDSLPADEQKADIERQKRHELERLRQQQAMAEAVEKVHDKGTGGAAVMDIEEAQKTAKALQEHKQVSDESKQHLVDIATAVTGHKTSLEEAVKKMDETSKSTGSFVDAVWRLTGVLETYAKQAQNLNQRVSFLEQQARTYGSQQRNTTNTLPGGG